MALCYLELPLSLAVSVVVNRGASSRGKVSKEPNVTTAQKVPSPTGHSPAAGQAELGAGSRLQPQSQGQHKAGLWYIQKGKKGKKTRPKTKLETSLRFV